MTTDQRRPADDTGAGPAADAGTGSRTVRVGSACAPWVRTRLRTAPGSAAALAVLVLLTAFLAAVFPRAVDAYETEGLHHDISSTAPQHSLLEVTSLPLGLEYPPALREEPLRKATTGRIHRELLSRLADPFHPDAARSSYGVHTTKALPAAEPWLPRPNTLPPRFTYSAPSALPAHSTLRSGHWPAVRGDVHTDTRQVEAAVTAETAATLHFKVGSTIEVPTQGGNPLTVRISGIITPLHPENAYWAAEPLMRAASLVPDPGAPTPTYFWTATLLLAPDAAPALLGTIGEPELFWRIAPDASPLTALDVPRLRSAVASRENGPGLLELRKIAGPTATLTTDLDQVLLSYEAMRSAISPVVAVAAVGIGAVAAVVLLMTGGLIATRRHSELALLRSRGGSLRGIGGRLLAEISVCTLPPAALGLLLAVLAVGQARLWPAVYGATAVAALVCVVLPLRTTLLHRRPQLHGARDDMMHARPSRRRTVTELTLLVLAIGAVIALRRRGTTDSSGGVDLLVSSAPVLVGLIAALVLVRLYPLPLRLAARPVARMRGAIGFLSLARAGRSSTSGALPLLALLIALTTAAFGGSVLAGVADARDDAAFTATGADARISTRGDATALTDRFIRKVRGTRGVDEVSPVQVEYGIPLPAAGDGSDTAADSVATDSKGVALIGVEPRSYARLAAAGGLDPIPADRLRATGPPDDRVLPAIASPSIAERLGDRPYEIQSMAGDFKVRVVGTQSRTSVMDDTTFLIVDAAALPHRQPTTLLVTGDTLDAKALRAAARDAGRDISVRTRSEERAAFADTPMQAGAERIYAAAVAAGAGYALLAVLLSLLQTAPERATLLARLRTMGLTTRQGGRLLGFEALPQALLAAVGGLLVGWATIALLAPGVDLARLALFTGPGSGVPYTAPLRADLRSLALPAIGVVALTAAVAAVQAWWASRRGSITELRAGDTR
ncbi:ABC transporter permease [Streptomyces sp. LN785]|uniref:ABC transporter permease n=1 Tax=Streptomyces sp. LN785 TaxID=3112983 RepID=UPI00372227F7